MPREGGGGSSGGGRGIGQSGGHGRRGGLAAGAGGNCACPKCGKTVPHQRAVPCLQVTCPECGTAMIRQT